MLATESLCSQVGSGYSLESHLLRHCLAVLVAEMAIGFHRQRSPVLMAEPARHRWNVHARFNAACGEQVPQVMVREPGNSHLLASTRQGLLAFADLQDAASGNRAGFVLEARQQKLHVGQHWHTPN